jgi:hypothetical protein
MEEGRRRQVGHGDFYICAGGLNSIVIHRGFGRDGSDRKKKRRVSADGEVYPDTAGKHIVYFNSNSSKSDGAHDLMGPILANGRALSNTRNRAHTALEFPISISEHSSPSRLASPSYPALQ